MRSFVESVLNEFGVEKVAATPGADHLFEIRESTPLRNEKSKKFHTHTAKLLYLSKRTRTDLLTAVSFLTTRVIKPTEDDWTKLERVMRYLN